MIQDIDRKPTVSVCIPSYNHSQYIQRCLESIFAQTYQPTELIVIDDGSTDGSPEVIEKVLKNCPFDSELIVRPNKGPAATVNEMLKRSRGEFYAGLASDDLWLPQFLERTVNLLSSRPDAVIAYCHCFSIDEDDKIIGCTTDWANYGAENAREMLLTMCCPQGPTVVFRKSALSSHEWKGVLAEDLDMFLQLCQKGEFAFEPSILSGYRTHSSNSSRQTKLMLAGQIEAFRRNADNLGLSREELAEIETRIKWESVNLYLGHGNRLGAVKTAFQHSHINVPISAKLRQYLKLVIPYSVLQAGRKKIKRTSDKWLGLDIKDLVAEQTETGRNYVDF